MIEFLDELVRNHGFWIVGLVIGLESMGLPLPGEILLIAASIWAATTHDGNIEWIVLAAAAGAILGDNAGYVIGSRLGRPALERHGPRIGLTVQRQRLGDFLFLRYGGAVVFFGRFIAFLRVFAAVLAGASRMPWKRFLIWNTAGGLVWTHLFGYGAYFLGNRIVMLASTFGLAMGVLTVGVLIGGFWLMKTQEHRLVRLAEREMVLAEAKSAAERAEAGRAEVG